MAFSTQPDFQQIMPSSFEDVFDSFLKFNKSEDKNLITNANGDLSHKTTKSYILDFFAGVCRSEHDEIDKFETLDAKIIELMPKCWNENPLLTLKLLFYKRDCRGGSGEKRIFQTGFRWVVHNHEQHALNNIAEIPDYGSYKDLIQLCDEPSCFKEIIDIFAIQLEQDMTNMNDNTEVSLAAKWVPSLRSSADRKFNFCKQLSQKLGYRINWQQQYRQNITKLRKHLDVVELKMSQGNWDKIDFSNVPSVAMHKYKNCFKVHALSEWTEYINKLNNKQTKVNAKQLMPHELLNDLDNPLTQHQWDALVKDVKSTLNLSKALAICDTSGSMKGLPMDVSVALGCLISEVSTSFSDKLISFSEQPEFYDLSNLSLKEKASQIRSKGDLNTDLVAVFKCLLDRCKSMNCSSDDMPQKIFIISDMQFDQACGEYGINTYENIKSLYKESNYNLPHVIFWNVTAANSFPVNKSEIGTCLVNGFSADILNKVLTKDITDPYQLMLSILNSDRYEIIQLEK